MIAARRPALLVASREIRERAGSRMFAVTTAVIVAIAVAGVVVPGLSDDITRVKVGTTGDSPPALAAVLRDAARANDARLELGRYPSRAAGEDALRSGKVDVLIADGRRLVWKSDPDPAIAAAVTVAVQRVRGAERAAALGLDPRQSAALVAPAPVPARQLEATDPDAESREAIAFVGFMLLLSVIIGYGTAVADGVAQEKGNRVMEVLLSRVRPRDLLAGKVVGIGLVGLTQMLLGVTAGAVVIVAFDTLDVPAAVPEALAAVAVAFVLGYAFWSVAFATVGALVSRVEDLQAAIGPLTWALLGCSWTAPVTADAPGSWYAQVASIVPLTSPFAMPARIATGDVAAWELALAVALIVGATYGLVRLAAAVYSGALLRTGGRPRARDLWGAAREGLAR